MALYVSIDESYSVSKLSSLDAVVKRCGSYTLQDGSKVTKAIVKQELKSGSLNVYDYSQDDLEEAKENGYVRGIDWTLKIQII